MHTSSGLHFTILFLIAINWKKLIVDCQKSSCSDYFEFTLMDGELVGEVTTPGSGFLPGSLEVDITVNTRVEKDNVGYIEAVEVPNLYEHLKENLPLKFIVHFPTNTIHPKLKAIRYCGELLCEEPHDVQKTKIISKITLFYTIKKINIKTTLINENTPEDDPFANLEPIEEEDQLDFKKSSVTKPSNIMREDPNTNNQRFECGHQTNINALIIGGETTQKGDWPWVVSIFIDGGKINPGSEKYRCTGTIISSHLVVTVAHCKGDKNAENFIIRAGVHNIDYAENDIQRRIVDELIFPDNNLSTKQYALDIMVMFMQRGLVFNNNVSPVCLWEYDGIEVYTGIVVGWGRDENDNPTSDVQKKVNVKIAHERVCKRSVLKHVPLLKDDKICSTIEGASKICLGDSGAGLVVYKGSSFKLRGIVEFNLGGTGKECNPNNYVIYTDAGYHAEWMKNLINKYS